MYAFLNASTYYQFFCVYTDGRHINPTDVHSFPASTDQLPPGAATTLSELSARLEQGARANVSLRRKSGLLIESLRVSVPQADFR